MYLYIVFHIKYNMIITDDCEENVVLKGERGVILTSWMQEWDKRWANKQSWTFNDQMQTIPVIRFIRKKEKKTFPDLSHFDDIQTHYENRLSQGDRNKFTIRKRDTQKNTDSHQRKKISIIVNFSEKYFRRLNNNKRNEI